LGINLSFENMSEIAIIEKQQEKQIKS